MSGELSSDVARSVYRLPKVMIDLKMALETVLKGLS